MSKACQYMFNVFTFVFYPLPFKTCCSHLIQLLFKSYSHCLCVADLCVSETMEQNWTKIKNIPSIIQSCGWPEWIHDNKYLFNRIFGVTNTVRRTFPNTYLQGTILPVLKHASGSLLIFMHNINLNDHIF